MIGTHGLAAPPGMAARIIVTYQDIFNRKLASIFDITYAGLWQSVEFPIGVPKDLADLKQERDAAQVRLADQMNQPLLNPALRGHIKQGPE